MKREAIRPERGIWPWVVCADQGERIGVAVGDVTLHAAGIVAKARK
ncbi:MAG: hypothetical protein ACSLFA_02230 [Mycobacterium sp.]